MEKAWCALLDWIIHPHILTIKAEVLLKKTNGKKERNSFGLIERNVLSL